MSDQITAAPAVPDPLVQINCYPHVVTLTRYEQSGGLATYPIQLEDLAIHLNKIRVSSGFLPSNVLAWGNVDNQTYLVWYVPASVYTVTTTVRRNRPKQLRIPLPAAVMVGHGKQYGVFAVKRRPRDATAPLFLFPSPNLGADYNVCKGTAAFPTISVSTMDAAWQAFIGSGFNDHGAKARCHSKPKNILTLWRSLHKAKAEKFPSLELCGNQLPAARHSAQLNNPMFDNLNITDYHIYRGGTLPAMTAQLYQYLLAANGVFVQAQSRHWQAVIPVAHGEIRGLAPLQPQVVCRHGQLPGSLLAALLTNAKQAVDASGRLVEALYRIQWHNDRWHVTKPTQTATALTVNSAEPADNTVVMELHTHAQSAAFFSSTDNADEMGMSVYGVFGRLHQPTVEICLRIGIFGHFYALPVGELFTDPPATLNDVTHTSLKLPLKPYEYYPPTAATPQL